MCKECNEQSKQVEELQSNPLLTFFAQEINALTIQLTALRTEIHQERAARVATELRLERVEDENMTLTKTVDVIFDAVNDYFGQATREQVSDFESLLADAEIVHDHDVSENVTFDDDMTILNTTDHEDEPGWMSD